MMNWINVSERLPPLGKLVYTKDELGHIGAFTLFPVLIGTVQTPGWNSLICTDNNAIIAWLETEEK
jgi:hypothetical protein